MAHARPFLRYIPTARWWALLVCVGGAVGCQPQQEATTGATPPPVGHYEGSISLAGQPELRAALDIHHPSPGHYEAELTVPAAGTLNFVADTILYADSRLTLRRPARPGQVLTLTQDGDFWRGSLALDSAKATVILLKRGTPLARTYRVEEAPQANGAAWLFAPADTGTPGPALVLLPDAQTAPTAALWADALARNGIIALLLPVADSATSVAELPRLQTALGLLRGTAGTDTANVGVWAAGARATALATALTENGAPRPSFFIAQNADLAAGGRAAFRELKRRQVPVLGLYGGGAGRAAGAMQQALGGRRGTVRSYRGTGPDLLVPGGISPRFGPGLPEEVVQWLPRK